MNHFLAAAALSLALAGAAGAQLVDAERQPAIDMLRAAEVPVSILGEASEACPLDGQGLFDIVLGSMNAHGINWVQAEPRHDHRAVVTLYPFGEADTGCAAYLLIELDDTASLELDYSADTFDSTVTLARLDTRFGPTRTTGTAYQAEFFAELAPTLSDAWAVLLDD